MPLWLFNYVWTFIYSLTWWFSTGDNPEDLWQCLESFLISTTEGGLVEAKKPTKYPTIHKTAPTTKSYLDQDINSAKVSSDSSKAVDFIKRVNVYISIPKTHQSAWHKIGSQ